ncbi:MAG: DNA-binding MarR family transcriptional regulator [Acidimicrobiales bacterium]|jgi:DNA-binding MarR family transcriptional regulator
MSRTPSDALGQEFVGLIHAFGVLRTDATPCGQPMSVSTAHAICELAAHGPLSQTELAGRLGLEASSISRLVDQLSRKGWAQRAPDPDSNDKRVRLVHLAAPGRQAAKQVTAARAERFGQLLDAIEESKRPQVLEALHLLKDAANAID